MLNRIQLKWFLSLAFILSTQMLTLTHVHAAVAVVINASGVLSLKQADGSVKVIYEKSELEEGDVVSTEKNSYARFKFTDGGEITLRPESTLKIDSYSYAEADPKKDNFVFSLVKGGLRTVTGLVGKRGNRDAYRLQTPTATIGIRGTNYGGMLCTNNCGGLPAGLYLDVIEGAINVANDGGSTDFVAGQFGYAASFNQQPVVIPKDPGMSKFDADNEDAFSVGGQGGCIMN